MDNTPLPPKGPGQLETPGDGRVPNTAGIYELNGKQVIVMKDAKSTAQQDALVRMGFVRVADSPTRLELKAMQDAQLQKDMAAEKAGTPNQTPLIDLEAPTVNPTASLPVDQANELAKVEKARADAAEAELAAMKQQVAPSDVPAPSEPVVADETPATPEAPETSVETETDTKTNETKGE